MADPVHVTADITKDPWFTHMRWVDNDESRTMFEEKSKILSILVWLFTRDYVNEFEDGLQSHLGLTIPELITEHLRDLKTNISGSKCKVSAHILQKHLSKMIEYRKENDSKVDLSRISVICDVEEFVSSSWAWKVEGNMDFYGDMDKKQAMEILHRVDGSATNLRLVYRGRYRKSDLKEGVDKKKVTAFCQTFPLSFLVQVFLAVSPDYLYDTETGTLKWCDPRSAEGERHAHTCGHVQAKYKMVCPLHCSYYLNLLLCHSCVENRCISQEYVVALDVVPAVFHESAHSKKCSCKRVYVVTNIAKDRPWLSEGGGNMISPTVLGETKNFAKLSTANQFRVGRVRKRGSAASKEAMRKMACNVKLMCALEAKKKSQLMQHQQQQQQQQNPQPEVIAIDVDDDQEEEEEEKEEYKKCELFYHYYERLVHDVKDNGAYTVSFTCMNSLREMTNDSSMANMFYDLTREMMVHRQICDGTVLQHYTCDDLVHENEPMLSSGLAKLEAFRDHSSRSDFCDLLLRGKGGVWLVDHGVNRDLLYACHQRLYEDLEGIKTSLARYKKPVAVVHPISRAG